MKCLAFDCSSSSFTVALKSEDKIIQVHKSAVNQHAELILPSIEELLQNNNIKLAEIDAIFYGRGPGSFMGIRTAVSVAQGLSFAENIPLIALSSLQIIAQVACKARACSRIVVATDARLGEVYLAAFQVIDGGSLQQVGEEKVLAPEAINLPDGDEWFLAGNGWSTYADKITITQSSNVVLVENIIYPEAKHMFSLGEKLLKAGYKHFSEQAEPCYVRNNVAKTKAQQKRGNL